MKTVLIVDDEKLFLASLTEGLSVYTNEFAVITAASGQQGLEILDSDQVNLVVTDLKMLLANDFQMLTGMINQHQTLPVIVMAASVTPETENYLKDFNTLSYLEKPIDFYELSAQIRAGLKHTDNGIFKDIALSSFVQLLAAERKTCSVKIISKGREGALHFFEGELFDAACDKLGGEPAAREIISWEKAEIKIADVYKMMPRSIYKPLVNLMAEVVPEENGLNLQKANWLVAPLRAFDAAANDLATGNGDGVTVFNPRSATQFNQPISNATNNLNQSIEQLINIEGAIAAALVDRESGLTFGQAGTGVNVEIAAASNSEIVKSNIKMINYLGLNDAIEDILLTLGSQHHLIRPLASHPNLFFYIVLDRANSNLVLARSIVSDVAKNVAV